MFSVPLAATKAKISASSLSPSAAWQTKPFQYLCLKSGQVQGVSWETVTALPGVSMMPSTGEFPSDGSVCTLSSVLETNAPEKYYLSPRACNGILNRAKKRGKELPPMLKEALEEVLTLQ